MQEENDDRNTFISRIGTFFLLLGILVVIVFIASDIGDNTHFGYFFLAMILLVIGWVLKKLAAPPPVISKRFEGIRRLQQRNREKKAENNRNK